MIRRVAGAIVMLLAIIPGSPAVAQTVSVRAFIDRSPVGLNEQFNLSVEITGAVSRLSSNPELPDMNAFSAYLGSSSSQQVQTVNGRTSVSMTLQYRFQATAVGSFRIGRVSVGVAGRTYRTEPIDLEISRTATAGPGRGNRGVARNDAADVISADDLFLKTTIDKQKVYQNEPVVVEYKIYTTVPVTSYILSRPPATTGFWAEDFPLASSPETHTEVLNGKRYTVATLKKTALFPTGAGKRTVSAMTLSTEVRVGRTSRDPFDNFFRSPLLDRTVTKLITSKPLTVTVEPLPAEGKPVDFSGLVGSLAVAASIDKRKAETNEAITLRVELSGSGNMRMVPEPKIGFPPDVETYPPRIDEKIDREGSRITGTKSYEFVMIPRAPGSITIPPITYAYFDRSSRSYKSVATRPIVVDVTGDAVTAPRVAGRVRGEILPLREDIRFIQTGPPALRPAGRSLFDGALFWIVLTVPLMFVGGAMAGRRHLDRLQGDVAYARHRRASRVARKRMAAARALADHGTQKEFYAEAGRALLGFLGDKLNIAEAGFLKDEVRNRLQRNGVSDQVADAYFECIELCDLKRFSPSAAAPAEMLEFLGRAENAMSDLDRAIAK